MDGPTSPTTRQQAAWTAFIESLSPQARQQLLEPKPPLPPIAEENFAFQQLLDGLSPSASAAMAAGKAPLAEPAESFPPPPLVPRYCLVVVPDGERPTLRVAANLKALAHACNRLCNQDVHIFPFLGMPIRFTQGPQRLLVLPDHTLYAFYPQISDTVDVFSEVKIQDDWYIGEPDLTVESGYVHTPDGQRQPRSRPPAVEAEPEEEGEDPDDSGSPVPS